MRSFVSALGRDVTPQDLAPDERAGGVLPPAFYCSSAASSSRRRSRSPRMSSP